ncbi:MAG: ferrous iron transporter B [Sphingomonadales bacterium]
MTPVQNQYRLALTGSPNCGKSSLFNALTGKNQKVANYPGVTVEGRLGTFKLDNDVTVNLIDLPGSYSLKGRSPDEKIFENILAGNHETEPKPEILLHIVDTTNLRLHLRLAIELKELGIPMILVLNMMDLAQRDQISIDPEVLSKEIGLPVIFSIAVRSTGLNELKKYLSENIETILKTPPQPTSNCSLRDRVKESRKIASKAILHEGTQSKLTKNLDQIVLHKTLGPLILFAILFFMFQSVFTWAETPMAMIDQTVIDFQRLLLANLGDHWFRSLLIDGVLSGVGSVFIFLPQILILFSFILFLEATGYMARAAFLMDRMMASVGLNGRTFIPLLSSFACAIPGIMAARNIEDPKDRLTTILIAPLMTCSARLPVYTLLISAFIPNDQVWGVIKLQGVVMFGLYLVGILSALIIAGVLKNTLTKGSSHPLLMELPKYQIPQLRNILMGLVERTKIFIKRAGTIILYAMIILWGLGSYPNPPKGATLPDIYYSFAGYIGRGLEFILSPLGFNWEISIALVPGMAAREVAVAALGTVYSLSGEDNVVASSLVGILQNSWSLPTGLAFLAWYIFAPQCLSTLAVAKRETNSVGWAWFMAGYLFALAYIAAFITYRVALIFSS